MKLNRPAGRPPLPPPPRGPQGDGGPQGRGGPQGPGGPQRPPFPPGEITESEATQLKGELSVLQSAVKSALEDGTVSEDEAKQIRELRETLNKDTFTLATNDERMPKLQ